MLWSQARLGAILIPPPSGCATLGKDPDLSEPQISHLWGWVGRHQNQLQAATEIRTERPLASLQFLFQKYWLPHLPSTPQLVTEPCLTEHRVCLSLYWANGHAVLHLGQRRIKQWFSHTLKACHVLEGKHQMMCTVGQLGGFWPFHAAQSQ